MKNAEAQTQYRDEVAKLVRDLNMRYVRARLKSLSLVEAEATLDRLLAGEVVQGVAREDLLTLPHQDFFRRRGVPAFRMIGFAGETFTEFDDFAKHLTKHLPEAYLAGRDFKDYLDLLRLVTKGELTPEQAAMKSPTLRRVGGACPCSKSVRWVVDDPSTAGSSAHTA